MTNYRVTLKPLTPFFFGGENTFGEGSTVNYFARSNYLPQQTTILGFLRYELLAQNGLLGTDPVSKKWSDLIGPESFQKKNGTFTRGFGAISNISPVFLTNGQEHYIPQSMDWAMYKASEIEVNNCKVGVDALGPIELTFSDNGVAAYYGAKPAKAPSLQVGNAPFDPKYGLKELWVSSDGKIMRQWEREGEKDFKKGKGYLDGLFVPHQQVGIHRKVKDRSKNEKGDFYKKVSYTLDDGFAFAFYIEMELPDRKEFKSRVVTMGGERSTFRMEVTATTENFEEIFTKETFAHPSKREYPSIVLTSDAYVSPEILDNCDFAITDSVPFRNIATRQENNGNYVRMDKAGTKWSNTKKKSELLYLVKRGSIFFIENPEKLKKTQDFLENTAFRNIGYNHYITLNP